MRQLLSKLRTKRAADDQGFTLIELLVVVVILGVLIAIAIPLYLNYRKGANDAASQSDTRNAISVLEACNSSDGKYPLQATAVTWSATTSPCTSQKVNLSAGTQMKYISSADASTYMLVGTNTNGATKFYCYNSATAAPLIAVAGATTLAGTTC